MSTEFSEHCTYCDDRIRDVPPEREVDCMCAPCVLQGAGPAVEQVSPAVGIICCRCLAVFQALRELI